MKNKTKKFLLIALSIVLVSFILYRFIEVKLLLSISLGVLLGFSYYFYKEKIGQEFLVAFLIALAWTSYNFYEYTSANIYLGKINLFPLVAWTFGLVLLREIYERLGKYKFLKITFLYIGLMLLLEGIGYYIWGIKLNSGYPSFLGTGVLHSPLGWKLFYILVGPVYIGITDYLKVK